MGFICPGCTTEMDPMAESCPVCMRPRSRKEIFASMRKESGIARKPWVPFRRTSLKALAFLAVAHLAIQKLPFPRPAAPAPGARETGVQPPAASTAPLAAAPASPPPAAPPISAQPESPSLPRPPREADESPLMEDQTDPAVPKVWRVSGKVYDLFTLAPVAGTAVVFKDKLTGRTVRAKTDKKGLYSTPLPPLEEGGYLVSIRRAGYENNFLEEKKPPYRQYSEERREEEAALARQSQILHLPVRPEGDSTTLDYSIVLIPIPEE